MKITRVTPLVVAAPPNRNWIFVKVETDQPGLYGWGEATLEWKTRGVVGCIEDFEQIVMGHDPRDVTQLVELLNKAAFWPLGVFGLTAMSAIEQACWDIKGKDLGVPVWQLLGGKVRDRIRVYTHVGSRKIKLNRATREIGAYAESCAELREMGYNAVKTMPLPYTGFDAEPREVRHTEKLMIAMREALGPDVDLLLDFHGRPSSIAAAMAHIDVISPVKPMFVEEPIQPGDPAAMRMIAERADCPIATGERLLTPKEFEDICTIKAVTYIQPDLCHCGGLTLGRHIAAIAATNHIGVCPHNPMGPIAGVVGLHFGAATPNFVILEESSGAVPWYDDVVTTPIERVDGYWQIPTKPGLGVEINEEVARQHPFVQEVIGGKEAILARDGSKANW